MILSTSWARTKSLKDTNSWTFYYFKNNSLLRYTVITGTANQQLVCSLKDADATDFEDNYKSGATEVVSTWDAFTYLVTF